MLRAAAQIDQKQEQPGRDQQGGKNAAEFAHALLADSRFSRFETQSSPHSFAAARAVLPSISEIPFARFCFDFAAAFFWARGRFCVLRLRTDDLAFCSFDEDACLDSSRSLRSFLSFRYLLNLLYAKPPPNPAAAIVSAAAILTGPRPGAMCHGHLASGYLSGREKAQPSVEHLRAIRRCDL